MPPSAVELCPGCSSFARSRSNTFCKISAQETLRPVLLRAVWSLNLAFSGRRPQGSVLSKRFAFVELKGDWKFFYEMLELKRYWGANACCHRCDAAKTAASGQLFWNFGSNFQQRTTIAFINEVMPPQPSPLILLRGFHIRSLMLPCNQKDSW